MNGKDGEGIRQFLDGKGMLLLDQEDFGFEVFGQHMMLGHARTYGVDSNVTNSDEATAAPDSRKANGFKIGLLPGDADSF